MPIDVQIIPELKDALGAGFENIIYELNGTNPAGGSTAKKSPQRKRKVKGGENLSQVIEGGAKKRSRKTKSAKSKSKSRSKAHRSKSARSSRSSRHHRKSPSRATIKVGPRTAMGYFLERGNQVVLGPYPSKQEAARAKKRLSGIMHML